MGIIVLLIGISITIAVTFLIIFLWNIRSGQYDDTYTPSIRMLFEDKKKKKKEDDTTATDTKV
jgi:cbb3-type cytochrome oxidase maturation protein